jgi:HD-GYP domain-containing protein (c-di-GMP phosphodiesterase class II)/CHASE2 domain-containing sensor protein
LVALLVVAFWLSGVLSNSELSLLDHRFRARPPLPPSKDIVIVAIDEFSLHAYKQWPWPRAVHAALIDHLTKAGAEVIALDIIFDQRSREGETANDDALAAAIARSGRVVLPVFFEEQLAGAGVQSTKALRAIGILEEAAGGKEGHICFTPDPGGTLRRLRPFVYDPLRNAPVPAFSLVSACQLLGVPVPDPARWAGRRPLAVSPGRKLHTDGEGDVLANWLGGREGKSFTTVPFAAVLTDGVPDEVFRGKLVFVGTTVGGIGEQFFQTPLPANVPIPGILAHASAAETILRGNAIHPADPRGYLFLLFGLAFGLTFGFIRLRQFGTTYTVGLAALLLALLWTVARVSFQRWNFWFEFFPLAFLVGGALVFQFAWRLIDALRLVIQRRKQLDVVTAVGDRASSDTELSEDFRTALQSALTIADTDVGALWALDEKEEKYLLETVSGLTLEEVRQHTAALGEGALGQLLLSGDALVVQDAWTGSDEFESPLPPHFRSLVFLPLKARGRCVGLLCVAKREPRAFDHDVRQYLRTIASQSGLDLDNARLVKKLQRMFVSTLGALVKALETKDAYTRGHSDRVTDYAVQVARQLPLPPAQVETLRLAGSVHDVGKIGMPDIVLNKPGKLTDEEYTAFKTHAQYTGDILEDLDWLQEVRNIAMHHHERWDGRGYPDGLRGEACPLGARILAVTDAYDAMTSDRPYRKGMPAAKAVSIIVEEAGTQLDPSLVETFLHVPDAHWTEAAQTYLTQRRQEAVR